MSPSEISDDVLRTVVRSSGEIVIVRVTDVTHRGAGTRSEASIYRGDVVRPILGSRVGSFAFGHYGGPELQKGHTYVVALVPNGPPLWDGPTLRGHGDLHGSEDETANSYAARLSAASDR